MLAGELTISAEYFSPFANVSLADFRHVKVHLELTGQTRGSPGFTSKE